MQVYNAYVEKTFAELTVNEIESFFLQNLINGFTQSERFRTAKKIYNLAYLNLLIFSYIVRRATCPAPFKIAVVYQVC